jgi:acetamidase/formamidase
MKKPASVLTRWIPFLLILCLFTTPRDSSAGEAADAQNISGTWEWTHVQFGETNVDRCQFTVSGDKISGKAFWMDVDGTVANGNLQLKLLNGSKKVLGTLSGTVHGETMSGTMEVEGQRTEWSARRPAVRPANAPRRHEFVPTQYHRNFSGAIPPALTIFPGDTVHTDTIDAGGVDKNGVRRSPGGNPLNGPFYIEGALRGDLLAIHFNRIRLNRDTAQSGSSLAQNAVEPWYVSEKKRIENFDSNWKLDRERGIGRLARPTEKLKDFTVPLAPMLGCVGVAPPRNQSLVSGDLGYFGGNMDYNEIREGVTLYLPVFQTGALLFVGDGHAAEGDGELTGDALETSMEVEFTVEVLPGKSTNPRAESDEYLMALGIGNSLTDALQQATTGLAVWLEKDYGLNPSEVAMVLGFCMHYNIAEVVDPHVHVVAKIKKSALTGLKKTDQ